MRVWKLNEKQAFFSWLLIFDYNAIPWWKMCAYSNICSRIYMFWDIFIIDFFNQFSSCYDRLHHSILLLTYLSQFSKLKRKKFAKKFFFIYKSVKVTNFITNKPLKMDFCHIQKYLRKGFHFYCIKYYIFPLLYYTYWKYFKKAFKKKRELSQNYSC